MRRVNPGFFPAKVPVMLPERSVPGIIIATALLISVTTASGDAKTSTRSVPSHDTSYLFGFTFQGEYNFGKLMSEEVLRVFNEGVFDGWALIYSWNYGSVPASPDALADEVAWLKQRLAQGKHIWPSLSVSRMIQPADDTSQHAPPDLEQLPERRIAEGDRGWTARRLADGPSEVYLDWAMPGDVDIVRKYHRGQDAVPETTSLVAEHRSADGRA